MPNRKIFAAIVLCVFVLVVGLEWLPKQFVAPQTLTTEKTIKISIEEDKVLSEKEASKRDTMGYGVVGYFLLLSALLYGKIVLQRSHE